jgi:hypothetical protein
MTFTTAAWFLAALSFFCFSVIFWRFGNEPIRLFTFRQRDEMMKDELTEGFMLDFEGYLQSINTRNKLRYRIASGGFLVAGMTAVLLSLALSL